MSKDRTRPAPAVRRTGYVAAIVVFVVLWWIVGRLYGWGWPPFLTEEFGDVVPWLRFSLAVDIAFHAVYLAYDPRWFTAFGDGVRALVNAIVAIIILRVFPFDFSAYAFDWETLTRIVLIVAIVAAWIAAIAAVVKAIIHLMRESGTAPDWLPGAVPDDVSDPAR